MDMPFRTADQFADCKIDAILEKYEEYKKGKNS
jgi:hypothetical protein